MIQRVAVYVCIILLLLSLYNDLTKGTIVKEDTVPPNENVSIIKVKAYSGDTVLTLTEKLYPLETIDIDEIITIFKDLNPDADPYHLEPETYYYFPLQDPTSS